MHIHSYTDEWERRSRNRGALPYSAEWTISFSTAYCDIPVDIRHEFKELFVDGSREDAETIEIDVTVHYDCDDDEINGCVIDADTTGYSREAAAWLLIKLLDAFDPNEIFHLAVEAGHVGYFNPRAHWGTC